ncbi:MAG: NAD(P)H-dependent oxidoreductase [Bdellovibrionales bacterium]|nr:NAD(P)H-dependent oxidoreductase [Bdellovibrionales bacterium]
MANILRIQSSAQTSERSITRKMGAQFIQEWIKTDPSVSIVTRDVAQNPLTFVDQSWIAAAFTKPEDRTPEMIERLKESDMLIDEIIKADILVIEVPMYNYGIPAALKAWIDQIARIGRTFSFDLSRGDVPIEPILSGKKLVQISSRGEFGFEPGGIREKMNALDSAIEACAHYLGVSQKEIYRVTIEYQEFKDQRHEDSKQQAEKKITRLVGKLIFDFDKRPKVANL